MVADIQGTVFDINRYAIHDGSGIRTTVFLKGCPLRCRWCANPESQKATLELAHLKSECILCGKCLDVCPQNAIRLSDSGHSINRLVCDLCGKCVELCPAEALKSMGRVVSVEDLYSEVAADHAFWERSGGGVTLSGGEPLVQHRFAKVFLKKCRDEYVHTAIETCLHVSSETLADILPFVNTVICDLKIMDEEKHRKYTGVSNTLILKNMVALLKSDQNMLVRMPLVPGINDDASSLSAIGEYLQNHRPGVQLELMPYHRLGEGKYARLGKNCAMGDTAPASEEDVERAVAMFGNYNINIVSK